MNKKDVNKVINLKDHKKKKEAYYYPDENYIDEIVEEIVKEEEQHIDELTRSVLAKKNKK